MLDRRTLLAALAALPIAPALVRGTRAAESGVVRIGYQKNGILVVAKQQGIIEKRLEPLGQSVRWVEFSFGPPCWKPCRSTGSTSGRPATHRRSSRRPRARNLVYAAAQEAGGSGAGILLPKELHDPEPRRPQGQAGRLRQGVERAQPDHSALEKAGLGYADIAPVTLAPADAAAAFARGSIDAWTIWDPYFAIAEAGEGVRVLARATDITPQNNFFLASRPFAETRAPVLAAVIEALGAVAAWCTQNRGAVAELLSQGTGVPLAATRRAVDRTDYVIGPMTDRVAATQQAIADRFHALKLIPKPIRIADAVWTAPARNG